MTDTSSSSRSTMANAAPGDDDFYEEAMARAAEVAFFVCGTTSNMGPMTKLENQLESSSPPTEPQTSSMNTPPTLPLQELAQKLAQSQVVLTPTRRLTDNDDGGSPVHRYSQAPPPPPANTPAIGYGLIPKVTPSPLSSPIRTMEQPSCITPPHIALALPAVSNYNKDFDHGKQVAVDKHLDEKKSPDGSAPFEVCEDTQEALAQPHTSFEGVAGPAKKISIQLLDLSHPLSFVSTDGSAGVSSHDKNSVMESADVRGESLVEGLWESTATLPVSNVRPSVKRRVQDGNERKMKQLKEEDDTPPPIPSRELPVPSPAVLAERQRQAAGQWAQQEQQPNASQENSVSIVTLHTGDEPDDLSLDELFANQKERDNRKKGRGSRRGKHRKGHDASDGCAPVKRGTPPEGIFVPSNAVPQDLAPRVIFEPSNDVHQKQKEKDGKLDDTHSPHSPSPADIEIESSPRKKLEEVAEYGMKGQDTTTTDTDAPVNELALIIRSPKDDDSESDRPSTWTWILRFSVIIVVLLVVGLSVGLSVRDDNNNNHLMTPSPSPEMEPPSPTTTGSGGVHPSYMFTGQFVGSAPGARFGSGVALNDDGTLMAAIGLGGDIDEEPIRIFARPPGGQTWIPLDPVPDVGISSSIASSTGLISIASSPGGTPKLAVVANSTIHIMEYVSDTEWVLTGMTTAGLEWSGSSGSNVLRGSKVELLSDVSVSTLSLSRDGSMLAAGGLSKDGMAIVVGAFTIASSSQGQRWEMRGQPLTRRPATPLPILSTSLALSGDGDRLVISDWVLTYPGASVQTYEWSDADNQWVFLESAEIIFPLGPARLALSGNGQRLGVTTQSSGTSGVYEWDNNTEAWLQLGSDLGLGAAIDLDESGARVLIGSPLSNHAKVLEYDGEDWTVKGGEENGEFTDGVVGSEFGADVAMSSDGSVLAIGAPLDDDNGNDAGKVLTYRIRTEM